PEAGAEPADEDDRLHGAAVVSVAEGSAEEGSAAAGTVVVSGGATVVEVPPTTSSVLGSSRNTSPAVGGGGGTVPSGTTAKVRASSFSVKRKRPMSDASTTSGVAERSPAGQT